MTQASPEIILGIDDDSLLARGLPNHTSGPLRLRRSAPGWSSDADAVFVSSMAGLEMGVQPEYWSSQVIPTNQETGPQFAVTGISFPPHDKPDDPREELRRQLEAVVKAVRLFNRAHSDGIKRLAIDLRWVAPSELKPDLALQTIQDVLAHLAPTEE
jgi:hypothetical protein